MPAEPLKSPILDKVPHLEHGFYYAGVEPPQPLAKAHQVHGTEIHQVKETDNLNPVELPKADAVMSAVKSIWCGIQTADCIPVLMASITKPLAAAVHAGWRGVEGGILPKVVAEFEKQGVRPRDIMVAMGPSIARCCFEVGPEVIAAFESKWGWMWAGNPRAVPHTKGRADLVSPAVARDPLATYAPPGAPHRDHDLWLDLKAVARMQLTNSGVLDPSIDDVPICTYCGVLRLQGQELRAESNDLASFRRGTHTGTKAGRQWSVLRYKLSAFDLKKK